MVDLIITSPVRGWAAPLEEVPDPVFAGRMLGDGVAIHPTSSTLYSPCDGVVVALHAARHAITIRSVEGAELLIHIGLETVALAGTGFTALVADGATVARGDSLIEFDLDLVATRAASLVTPIVLTNPEAFAIARRVIGQAVSVGEMLMTLRPIEADRRAWTDEGGIILRRTLDVPLVHGIHARPAARIAETARAFEAEIHLVCGDKRGSARSPVALLALGVKCGRRLIIEAQGNDAEAALEAIGALILGGMGEIAAGPAPALSGASAPPPVPEGQLAGTVASPGLAIGPAVRLATTELAVERDGAGIADEQAAFDVALEAVRTRIAAVSRSGEPARRAIMSAHLALLDDPELLDAARDQIAAGRSAGFAWRSAIGLQADRLRSTGDARLTERVDDLIDLERQVLHRLAGTEEAAQRFPDGAILLARDLLPSQLVGLDLGRVAGLCLERGGPTSHVAILAAGMGLPSLCAMGEALAGIADGTALVLDAGAGRLHIDPDTATGEHFADLLADQEDRRAAALAAARDLCRTADDVRIEIFSNLGSLDDARLAVERGAEGSGLLRTEFLFLNRAAAPDEDEQAATYQAIADAMEGRPLIVRLLDIGGDKPAPYLTMDAEENPALGLRGVRVGLERPELLGTQIRAILRVRPIGQCRIMVPMIASLAELRAVRAVVEQVRAALGIVEPVELGVMIETPAAAITADLIATEADFLSIGTNDLTQYVLAMDRGNPAVAANIDPLHPAVLRLIARTCEGGATHGRWTGVCGGLASDPAGIPILIGLGVTELSTTPAFVPEAKALVRRLNVEACRAHAARALDLPSPAEVRALARAFDEELPR